MGSLLKEALKCLCGDKQWSYAIFWKIACRNPSLLVWEESYYEPAPCSSFSDFSGNESTELLLKEWEKLLLYNSQLSQHGRPSVDRVSLLINKMMMSNQVYVVGEGIVGRAAFTGSHQWILQENHIVNHPSEVLAELHQQFSAGMQTVAVIPVNPHGVVQLGSCQTIMETKRFVNEVKSLFMHLGGVPGALWSGNYNGKEVSLKIGKPLSLEIPVCTGSGNACSQVGNVMSSTRDSCSDKISATPASGHISQPSHSLMQEDVEDHMLKLQRAPAMTKFCNGLSPLKAVSVMKPNSLSEGRLDTGAIGAEMIFSSLDTWLNQWASHNARSGLNHGLPVGQSDITSSIPASIKQQVPFDIGLRKPVNNGLRSLNSINPSQLRSNGGTVTDSLNDSVVSILEGCESSNASSNNSKLTSNPCSHSIPCRSEPVNSSSSVEVMGHQFVNCSKIDIVPSSCHANHSRSVGVFPEVPKTSYHTTSNKDAQTELAARKQGIENDLFQALNIQSDLKDEHNFGREPILDCLHDCLVSRQKHDKANPSVGNIASPDAHSRGNDLFDILGFDFRSERPKSWNNLQIYGADATTQNAYISPCTTHLEPDPNFYAANEWMSESGIFSESRPDHLLEAMVSKIYCPDKQNSDDTESCRTTLTMISGSSIPTGSPKHSQASVSNQMRVDSGLPPRLAKSGIVGSSSSKSGSSKGNAGECSQTNTIYGSQISSWVEEGQNMKRGNSIITACSKGPDEIMKSNRKRLRPGESPRPRPKDRQMIQDRVKELREIVPNGAKCSIDALLERTIKHMLFLQSVTKHADKLKQTGESKIISKDGGLLLRDNFEGGATWAFELGSRSMVCPIIVEDLNPPRQMLVEMLCEEHGFFLEIADIIRGLGLTILKGVMEARNDKIWARFAVEANRDVTRMEIFLALVRLLEQTMKGIGSTEGVNNDKLGMNHPLHPVSIPATGSSNAFH